MKQAESLLPLWERSIVKMTFILSLSTSFSWTTIEAKYHDGKQILLRMWRFSIHSFVQERDLVYFLTFIIYGIDYYFDEKQLTYNDRSLVS